MPVSQWGRNQMRYHLRRICVFWGLTWSSFDTLNLMPVCGEFWPQRRDPLPKLHPLCVGIQGDWEIAYSVLVVFLAIHPWTDQKRMGKVHILGDHICMIVPKALFSISNLQPLQARTVELLSQAFLLLALTISIRNIICHIISIEQGSVTENWKVLWNKLLLFVIRSFPTPPPLFKIFVILVGNAAIPYSTVDNFPPEYQYIF